MSVIVKNLTKIYGEQRAVQDLSFEAKAGEILGFLGPNGAGKSTTMKIITCFLPASSGEVIVCGGNAQTDSLFVRSQIGYLPEHNPLYKDMYVREYLYFVATLHKLPKARQAVDEMVERVGLTRERHKLIGSLSKGYRQRVGLAQAMLHDPKVLILDEPTSGLDPNQLIEIRELIRTMSKEKTVIFSSHIMQEVEALCERAIIINRGELVADDTIANLRQRYGAEKRLSVEFSAPLAALQLRKLQKLHAKIRSVEQQNNTGLYFVATDETVDLRADIFNFAVNEKLVLLALQQDLHDMGDVFQRLTSTQSPK